MKGAASPSKLYTTYCANFKFANQYIVLFTLSAITPCLLYILNLLKNSNYFFQPVSKVLYTYLGYLDF